MKNKINAWIMLVFILVMVSACDTGPEKVVPEPIEAGITVYNPLGQPPAIERVPMAQRINDLKGKTIYIVDIGFSGTHQFLVELQEILQERYPDTEWVLRNKIGTYFNDDPNLWAEVKEKGHAMIMGVGH